MWYSLLGVLEPCYFNSILVSQQPSTTEQTLLTQLYESRILFTDAGNSPWMVFEFMPYGDLAEVLRRNSRQFWKPIPGLAKLTKVCRCLLVEGNNLNGRLRALDAVLRLKSRPSICPSAYFISETTGRIPINFTFEVLHHSWTETYLTV